MSDVLTDQIIYQEMMAHPVLFFHPCPKKIMIIDDSDPAIITEALKHSAIQTISTTSDYSSLNNKRIQYHASKNWLANEQNHFDVIIITPDSSSHDIHFQALDENGILLQLSHSPFEINKIKTLQQALLKSGFKDLLILSFPQPHFPTGWRSAVLAKKKGTFNRIREKDIFNKDFSTRFYNFDVHKAALAVPEFLREEVVW